MSTRSCGAATWLAEIYTPQAPPALPAERGPDLVRHLAGLVACLLLLLAVLALAGAVLH